MKHVSENFKNASFTLCGATCFLLLAQYTLCEVGIPEALPATGLGYVTGLCWHILFFWAGMLLRQFLPNPRWWIQLPNGQFVPCSYNDYIQACNDEIPERWLHEQERLT